MVFRGLIFGRPIFRRDLGAADLGRRSPSTGARPDPLAAGANLSDVQAQPPERFEAILLPAALLGRFPAWLRPGVPRPGINPRSFNPRSSNLKQPGFGFPSGKITVL